MFSDLSRLGMLGAATPAASQKTSYLSSRTFSPSTYVIRRAEQYIRQVGARRVDVRRARSFVDAAKEAADQGEELRALALAREAIFTAKTAIPKDQHGDLQGAGDALLVTVDLTVDAYDSASSNL